ncbi:MAG: peptidoglycan DD-metalloendopeptidase family protein [Aggregatilineales bacterium]
MSHSFRRTAHLLALALVALLLAGCGGARLPQALPTMAAPVGGAPVASTPPPAEEQPEDDSVRLVLPGTGGVTVACDANTLRLPLIANGAPVGVASRILAADDVLYLLADGELYRLRPEDVDAGSPQLVPALTAGLRISGPVVQEIADIAYDAGGGAVYALDKAGHVYRVDTATGDITLAYRAFNDPDDQFFSQLVALTVDERGRPVVLDTAYGALWMPAGIDALDPVGQANEIAEGADVTYADGRFYVLQRDGGVVTVSQPSGASPWQDDAGRELTLSVSASNHLGPDVLVMVDALRREVLTLRPGNGETLTTHVFDTTGIGLLRDAVFTGGRLYAVADGDLLVFPGRADGMAEATCPPPDPSGRARPLLYGHDVLAALEGWEFPIRGGTLPAWPRLYPGSSRIYRQGVHHGLDVYYMDAPEGFGIGWHILAPSAGQVVRTTVGYVPMTGPEFDRLVSTTETAGYTPPELLERFEGKQIEIEHGNGVRTRYLHLDDIADGIVAGAAVQQGQFIGTVGVTGTEGEARPEVAGPHLHLEIWLEGRYLGQGITIPETMWWLEQIFTN